MSLIKKLPGLKAGKFNAEPSKKVSIFIHSNPHFQSAQEVLDWENQAPYNTGTCLVVDTKGKCSEIFPQSGWANHVMSVGSDEKLNIQSLGITVLGDVYSDEQIETIVKVCRDLVDEHKIIVQKDLSGMFDYSLKHVTELTPGIWAISSVDKLTYTFNQPKLIKALKKEFNQKPKNTNA